MGLVIIWVLSPSDVEWDSSRVLSSNLSNLSMKIKLLFWGWGPVGLKVVAADFLSDKLTALEALSVHWIPLLLCETLKERLQENGKLTTLLRAKNPLFLVKRIWVWVFNLHVACMSVYSMHSRCWLEGGKGSLGTEVTKGCETMRVLGMESGPSGRAAGALDCLTLWPTNCCCALVFSFCCNEIPDTELFMRIIILRMRSLRSGPLQTQCQVQRWHIFAVPSLDTSAVFSHGENNEKGNTNKWFPFPFP